MENAQRTQEIDDYTQEFDAGCVPDSGAYITMKQQRRQAFRCKIATDYLEMIADPSHRTPMSDREKAQEYVDKYCGE